MSRAGLHRHIFNALLTAAVARRPVAAMPRLLCDARDRWNVLLAGVAAATLLTAVNFVAVALLIWWVGNTIGHHAIHRRTFRSAPARAVHQLSLSLLLGVPMSAWRELHLAHHAGRAFRLRASPALVVQASTLLAAALTLAMLAPRWWWAVYAPGWALGMALAWLHGRGEHLAGPIDQRSRLWNLLWLNDGFHAEHHAFPSRHWRELGSAPSAQTSLLPPPLRALLVPLQPANWLDAAERWLLRCTWLRHRVLAVHRRALDAIAPQLGNPRRIVVVGGGLFPRSALLLRERFPTARITVLDRSARHLALAQRWLPSDVQRRVGTFVPGEALDADLVVLPLALRGLRAAWRARPPAPLVLVHDWGWRERACGSLVAWWLGKRMYVQRSTVGQSVRSA